MIAGRLLIGDEAQTAAEEAHHRDHDEYTRALAFGDADVPPELRAQPQNRSLPLTNLGAVLDEIDSFLSRYVAFPTSQARVAVALWIVHCWTSDAFESTPRLHVKSAEKQSGKTRLLECIELLAWRPLPSANCTTAALFRSISEKQPPTVLLDEVDTIFGPKAPDGSEDLRGLINAGHRRGKPVRRCVGPMQEPKEFPSFCPMALAGIGDIPDTIADRCIEIRMRRRAPGETIKPFRHRTAAAEADPIRSALAATADELVEALTDHYPALPPWLTDRPADVWEPCIAIADLASAAWYAMAIDAAATLLSERSEDEVTLGTRLLADIRTVMGSVAAMTTETLITGLAGLKESPWGEWNITPRWLGMRLKPYGIHSRNVRIGNLQAKGYDRECFSDAWSRYVETTPAHTSVPSVPSS